jgi:uncharacterized membrane protein YidH (DUF202 family)
VIEDGEGADSGLARERTQLAWNRSGLAVLAAVTVTVRRLWPIRGDKAVLALALIAVGAVAWALSMRLSLRGQPDSRPHRGIRPSTARLLTLGTLALAAAAFLVGLLTPN